MHARNALMLARIFSAVCLAQEKPKPLIQDYVSSPLAGLPLEDVTFRGKRDQPEAWLHPLPEKEWSRTYRVPKPTTLVPENIDYSHHLPDLSDQRTEPAG